VPTTRTATDSAATLVTRMLMTLLPYLSLLPQGRGILLL